MGEIGKIRTATFITADIKTNCPCLRECVGATGIMLGPL